MEQPNYYAILPSNVRYANISDKAKLIYCELLYLSNENKEVSIDIERLSKLYNVSIHTMNIILKELKKNGYIDRLQNSYKSIKEMVKTNNSNKGVGNKICEWCGIKTFVLCEHHFPIPKRDGGNKTVNICPNCHNNFHFIESTKIYLLLIDNKIFNQSKKILKECNKNG